MSMTFQKRQKELKRQEKQRAKAEKREQRKAAKRAEEMQATSTIPSSDSYRIPSPDPVTVPAVLVVVALTPREEKILSVKVVAAINDLNRHGHCARLYKHDGKVWVEIDQCMLASFAEIEGLVDGVHSFEELAEVLRKRHAQELG